MMALDKYINSTKAIIHLFKISSGYMLPFVTFTSATDVFWTVYNTLHNTVFKAVYSTLFSTVYNLMLDTIYKG